MNAATRVCGQLVHISMKPDVAKMMPASTLAARPSPSRRRNANIPPIATTNSPSFTNAGASHTGIRK